MISKINEFEQWVTAKVVKVWELEGISKHKIAEMSGFSRRALSRYLDKYKEEQKIIKDNNIKKILSQPWSTWKCTSEKTDLPNKNMKQL